MKEEGTEQKLFLSQLKTSSLQKLSQEELNKILYKKDNNNSKKLSLKKLSLEELSLEELRFITLARGGVRPDNPEETKTQEFVNLINAIPLIGSIASLNKNWEARTQNMKELKAVLEPSTKDREALNKILSHPMFASTNFPKLEFAKSAVNILSRDDNKDLLKPYLIFKGFSENEISEALESVNEAKHRLLTGEDIDKLAKIKNPTQESGKKQFIESLGYNTKAEIDFMSSAEIRKMMSVLEKDFGMKLENDGTIKYEKPKTLSENYQKELKTANNINERVPDIEGKSRLDYGKQNDELKAQEEQKAKENENNQNYSRTSTGDTPQSGMNAKKMAGNAAVLGGAIASAVVIPFVGWIVALAILYSFKDKFKDDPIANEEFEKAAKGLTKNGKSEKEAEEKINELKKEIKQQHPNKNQELDNVIEELQQNHAKSGQQTSEQETQKKLLNQQNQKGNRSNTDESKGGPKNEAGIHQRY